MADDSKEKEVRKANRLKLDFKGWTLISAILGFAALFLFAVFPQIWSDITNWDWGWDLEWDWGTVVSIVLLLLLVLLIVYWLWNGNISGAVGLAIGVLLLYLILESCSVNTKDWFVNKRWVTVKTETFAPNGDLFAQEGWYSVPLSPGKYRVKVTKSTFRLSVNEAEGPVSLLEVPIEGISLSRWEGSTYESDFMRQAPYPRSGVGAVVVRLNGVNYPIHSVFTIVGNDNLQLGVNLLPYGPAYADNQGEITVTIEQEIVVD